MAKFSAMSCNKIKKMKIKSVDVEDCYYLRSTVLRPNQPKSNWTFSSDRDESSLHMAMENEMKEIIAVVSFIPEKLSIENSIGSIHDFNIRLRSMAVREDMQGQGYGSKLLDNSLKKINKNLWCTARKHVANFYLKHNFKIFGEEFIMNDMPHVYMVKLSNP